MGRRSRWVWPKVEDKVVLTDFDLAVFEQLARYRYLRKDLLARLLPDRSDQTLTKRIGRLWAARYLLRPEGQQYAPNANYNVLYYQLTDKGRQALKDAGMEPYSVTQLHGTTNFAHDAAGVCNSIASIEAGAKLQGYDLVTWEEIASRVDTPDPFRFDTMIEGHRDKFRPDGFFGLLKDGQRKFYALEHERGNGGDVDNLKQASWRKKVLAYHYFITAEGYKTALNISNMRVLVTTTSAKKAQNLANLTEKLIGKSNLFLFRHVPKLGSEVGFKEDYPDLFASQWLRAGEPTMLQ